MMFRRVPLSLTAICLTLTSHVATCAWAQGELAALEDGAVTRLQQYLRVDTVNPPGNESRAVEFFARIFQSEGIAYETAESAPGRGNIWARLEGGAKPGIILINHMDVVPADAEQWSVPPLSAKLRDGHIYGRGALDMKSTAILQLQAFLALHHAKKTLNRDVIFLATADEEAGGLYGAGWLIENRPEIFKNVGLLLNEGGAGVLRDGKLMFGIEVTQKVPCWLRLTATGQPGHGSSPGAESATTRLVRALSRIHAHPFRPRITPPVDAYFKAMAPHAHESWQESFANMAQAVRDPAFLKRLQEYDRRLHSLTRNTCSITRLEGSSKINVIPPKASAELDCRLLPDQDAEEFLNELRFVIDDASIEIETLMLFKPAVSRIDTVLYRAIGAVCRRHYPDAPIVPSVAAGFTDSHFCRDLGINCYGFVPVLIPQEDLGGIHGNDERISVENVKRGTRLMFEILQDVVY